MDNRIEGFEWHLPLAFKDSIAQCKFEQGDVIYRSKPNGENWGEEIINIDFMLQVKSPLRTDSAKGGDFDIFNYNWDSKIVFEKIYPNNHALNTTIESTQGAFYSFLWKNDERFITEKEIIFPVLTSIRPKHINVEFIKSQIPFDCVGFAIVIDSVSNLVISKRNAINEALTKKFTYSTKLFTCNESIYTTALEEKPNSGFSPTLGVELFIIKSKETKEIEEEIKTVLFKGIKNRFNINTHGLLIEN